MRIKCFFGFHKWETYLVNTGYFCRTRRRCICCDTFVQVPKGMNSSHGWEKTDFRASEDDCSIQNAQMNYARSGIPANTTIGRFNEVWRSMGGIVNDI